VELGHALPNRANMLRIRRMWATALCLNSASHSLPVCGWAMAGVCVVPQEVREWSRTYRNS